MGHQFISMLLCWQVLADASTESVQKPTGRSISSEGALWWRIFLLVVWGGTDVKIPTTIRFMAAKGAHALLPPCPFRGPAKAHPILNCRRTAFELHVLPDHNPGGY